MLRFSRLILACLIGSSGSAFSLGAKTTPEKEATALSNKRAVSKNVAAALAARMPKYNPPEPEPEPEPEEEENSEQLDMREIDRPRNKIIRLPEYVVREDKPPVFRERDIYTDQGLGELAMKRYLSESVRALNRFTLPLIGMSPEAYALLLYREDERLKYISDLNETADDISRVDAENAEELRKATRDTYSRGFSDRYRNRSDQPD